jgi:primosomal protein N'
MFIKAPIEDKNLGATCKTVNLNILKLGCRSLAEHLEKGIPAARAITTCRTYFVNSTLSKRQLKILNRKITVGEAKLVVG